MYKKRGRHCIFPLFIVLLAMLVPFIDVSAEYENNDILAGLPNFNEIDTSCIKVYEGNPVDIATGWYEILLDINQHGDPGQWWFYQPFANNLFLPLQRQLISNDCPTCDRLIYTYIEPHTESSYIRLENNNTFFVIQWDKKTSIPYIVFAREIQKIDPFHPPGDYEVFFFPRYGVPDIVGDAALSDMKRGAPQEMTLEHMVTFGVIILIIFEVIAVIYKRTR